MPFADAQYDRWRNTVDKHTWGSAELVQSTVNAIALFKQWHPEQRVRVGDLDAPGPRHRYHRTGVDVDLYLPGAMRVESKGARRYENNYDDQPPSHIEAMQTRVTDLARALALCTDGKLRIFYNDPIVIERFTTWFNEQGYTPPPKGPMQPHNKTPRVPLPPQRSPVRVHLTQKNGGRPKPTAATR